MKKLIKKTNIPKKKLIKAQNGTTYPRNPNALYRRGERVHESGDTTRAEIYDPYYRFIWAKPGFDSKGNPISTRDTIVGSGNDTYTKDNRKEYEAINNIVDYGKNNTFPYNIAKVAEETARRFNKFRNKNK